MELWGLCVLKVQQILLLGAAFLLYFFFLWLQRYAVGNAVVHIEVISTFRENFRCSVRTGSQGFLENILNHKAKQFYGWLVNYVCHVNPC